MAKRLAPLTMLESGICIRGNGRGLTKLRGGANSYLLAATQNRGPVFLHRAKRPVKIIAAASGDAYALLYFKDGKKQKVEFYYGASFLSQSARFFTAGDLVTSVELVDAQGARRNMALHN